MSWGARSSFERVLRAGHLALLPHGCRARLRAEGSPARLVTVRALAASVSRAAAAACARAAPVLRDTTWKTEDDEL